MNFVINSSLVLLVQVRWMIGVPVPAGAGIFLFTTASRTALGPTQPPNQPVPGAFSWW